MKVLVTGAGGYIGRHLMVALGPDAIGLYRSVAPTGHLAADLTDERSVKWLRLPKGIDACIHLAGRVDIRLKPNPEGAHLAPVPAYKGPEQRAAIEVPLFAANVNSALEVLHLCQEAGIRHFIYASSQAVYGMPCDNAPFYEDGACRPLEAYAASKLAAEHLLQSHAAGMSITILRLPGIYGGDRESGAVWSMLQAARADGHVRANAKYPLPFDILHIDDATEGFLAALQMQPAGVAIYNVATGEPCSLDILAWEIAGLVPECSWGVAPVRQPEVIMNADKARVRLGWKALPRIDRLQQMLREMGWKA